MAFRLKFVAGLVLYCVVAELPSLHAGELRAGAAKTEIADLDAGPVNDPPFVKALVVTDGTTTAAIITVDAVAIGEIGTIRNDYLSKVRSQLQQDLGIDPDGVLINASHCHARVCADVDRRTVDAVKEAHRKLEPVRVGVGQGHEDRVSENRRLKLKSGREVDVRHAYSLPPDEDVVGAGPIDPEIGVVRMDAVDGRTVAVIYNFACHPIQGVPNGGNTADITGFASNVLETGFGHGAVALFLQGCGGDVNPLGYKDVDRPRDAEPLGHRLGMSTLTAARKIECQSDAPLKIVREVIDLPRCDNAERIAALEAEQQLLVQSLQGTSLNLKTYLALTTKHDLSENFPSTDSLRYLQERRTGRTDLDRLDAENRRHVQAYVRNVYTMEELTRLQTNLALLKKHQARNVAAGKRTIDVELVGVRLGDFVLVTFPGELTVPIGLNIKRSSPHPFTFVAGYTNGYIYYAPTAEQLRNVGGAQEDSDCLLAPEWQDRFEAKAAELLKRL